MRVPCLLGAGPQGEQYCWWQCTVKGGREGRDVDAVELAKAVEELGAGEILLNCIDNDGVGKVRCRGGTSGGVARGGCALAGPGGTAMCVVAEVKSRVG